MLAETMLLCAQSTHFFWLSGVSSTRKEKKGQKWEVKSLEFMFATKVTGKGWGHQLYLKK